MSNFLWYYQDEKDEYEFASGLINSEDKVLEVGCGEGKFKGKIDCDEYTGLEFSFNAIKKATEQGIKVLNESIELFARANAGKFDVVCSFQVLEHVTNISQFLNACISCLRENGLLILSVPNDESYVGKIKNDILNLPPHHVSRWSESVFRKIPELFEVKLEKIHKESVREEHKRAYTETKLLNKIYSKTGLVDLTFGFRIKRKLVSMIAGLFENKSNQGKIFPDGHSITAVYKKCSG